MPISAAQLIGIVRIEGADTGIAQVLGVGKAFDFAGGGPLTKFKEGLSLMGFGLSNVGTTGVKSGLAIRDAAVQMGGALWQVAGIATLVGGAIAVAIGAISVKAAADFQQGLNRLVTGAGDVTDNMRLMGQAILSVSTDSGVLTGPLLSAMYQIISAEQRGAQAENTLAVAARGSVIEQAKIVDVAKALTTAMTDYGTKTFNATQFMNGYTRAVQLGKVTLEELSNSMGPILPLAQNLGIKFADVAGAMSTMTNAGVPAERAATSLRFLFQSLENPTKKASTAMAEFGLNSVKLGNELKVSLPGALQMVYEAAKKAGPEGSVPFNRAVSDMIGGQRSLQAYLSLTGSHLATFKNNTLAITGAMTASKTSVLGWATAQGNFNVQLDRAKAAGQALLITIGQQLLPVLTQLLAAIVPIIAGFTRWLISSGALHNILTGLGGAFNVLGTVVGAVAKFFTQNEVAMTALKAVLIVAAAIIGGVLVASLVAAAVAAWGFTVALLANPIVWIAAAIIAAVALIVLAITHWGQITAWVGGVFSALGTWVHNVLSGIGSFAGSTFSSLGSAIRDKLTGIKNTVGGAFSAIGSTIHDALSGAQQTARNFATGVLNSMQYLYNHNYYVKAMVDGMAKDFKWIGDQFSALGSYLRTKQAEIGSGFSQMGSTIHNILTATKNDTGTIFSAIGTTTRNLLTGTKNDVGSIMSAIGTTVHNALSAIGSAFGSAFSSIGATVHNALSGIWGWIVSFLSGWPAQAFNWGRNFVQGLINGIGSMFSALGSAVSGLLGQLARVAGFHSDPPEGPAKDASTWMPNFVNMMVSGVKAGQGRMKAALRDFMSPLATTLNVQTSGNLSAAGGLSGAVARYGGSGAPVIHNHITVNPEVTLDGQRLTRAQMPYIANQIRLGANTIGR